MFIKFTCSGSEFKSWISLLIFCLIDLSNIVVEISHYYCVGVQVSLQVLCILYWVRTHPGSSAFLVVLILLPLCPLLIFVALKSIPSEARIATSAFYLFIYFCSPFGWQIFLHPFVLTLYVSLHIRWVWMKHTDGF